MSYSTVGYMHCEPFLYWGDLKADWQEFVARVDPGDYLFKLRYMSEALAYLDKVDFTPSSHYDVPDSDELDIDWFLTRRGRTSMDGDWWERTVLFPLSRNPFPFCFMPEKELEELIEREGEDCREEILEDIPGPFADEGELEEYLRENMDVDTELENLEIWEIKLHKPDPYYDKEMEAKNYCENGHIGSDALLDFLAKAGVVNRDLQSWMMSYHLLGEDGEEFSWARKIIGNEVVNPHERSTRW